MQLRRLAPLLLLCNAFLLALANTQKYVECDPRDPNDRSVGMGQADQYNIIDYINDLRDDGTCTVELSDDMDGGVSGNGPDVGARGNCGRTTCGNTSGVWLCNETNSTLSVDCGIVAKMALEIFYTCGFGFGEYRGHTQGEYSVYIGYANCKLNPEYGPFYQADRPVATPGAKA